MAEEPQLPTNLYIYLYIYIYGSLSTTKCFLTRLQMSAKCRRGFRFQ